MADASGQGRAVLRRLQEGLHFLSFAFTLPERTDDGRTPSLTSWRDDVHMVLGWLVQQHPQLIVRGLIGHGAAADACYAYASEYGHAASCPTRMLVQLAGSHTSNAPWPAGGGGGLRWAALSISGTDDGSSQLSAQLFHTRHADKGHRLRTLEGATRSFEGMHMATLCASINDWIEGARRLNADDSAHWSRPPSGGTAPGGGAKPVTAAATAAVAAARSHPVGSMGRVREIQVCEQGRHSAKRRSHNRPSLPLPQRPLLPPGPPSPPLPLALYPISSPARGARAHCRIAAPSPAHAGRVIRRRHPHRRTHEGVERGATARLLRQWRRKRACCGKLG